MKYERMRKEGKERKEEKGRDEGESEIQTNSSQRIRKWVGKMIIKCDVIILEKCSARSSRTWVQIEIELRILTVEVKTDTCITFTQFILGHYTILSSVFQSHIRDLHHDMVNVSCFLRRTQLKIKKWHPRGSEHVLWYEKKSSEKNRRKNYKWEIKRWGNK